MESKTQHLSFDQMQAMQKELQEKHKNKWQPLTPQIGRDKLLWMMIEAGEIADIIKKDGDEAIMNDPETREHLLEEICDTLMYLNDVLLCYNFSPEALEKTYIRKHDRNMKRW